MSTILLPIKPEYIELIFNGTKKYEYRKTLPKHKVTRIIVYLTAPTKAIVGEIEVKTTMRMKCDLLWEHTKNHAGITKKQFDEYFKCCEMGTAYRLGKFSYYRFPKQLDAFGIKKAPRSFIYLRECPYCHNVIIYDNYNSIDSNSKSEEHILPLSLGNDTLIIPKGIICDKCNNYFAREIEKPFLNNNAIKTIRFCNFVPSRKDRIPETKTEICNEYARICFSYKDNYSIVNFDDLSEDTIQKFISKQLSPYLFFNVDVDALKDKYYVSRFLVKVFTEINIYYSLNELKQENYFYVFDKKMKDNLQIEGNIPIQTHHKFVNSNRYLELFSLIH